MESFPHLSNRNTNAYDTRMHTHGVAAMSAVDFADFAPE